MRTPTRLGARPLLALGAVLCGLGGAGAAPAAAETLTQKPLPAGCIGEAPCTVGVETYQDGIGRGQPRRASCLRRGVGQTGR